MVTVGLGAVWVASGIRPLVWRIDPSDLQVREVGLDLHAVGLRSGQVTAMSVADGELWVAVQAFRHHQPESLVAAFNQNGVRVASSVLPGLGVSYLFASGSQLLGVVEGRLASFGGPPFEHLSPITLRTRRPISVASGHGLVWAAYRGGEVEAMTPDGNVLSGYPAGADVTALVATGSSCWLLEPLARRLVKLTLVGA